MGGGIFDRKADCKTESKSEADAARPGTSAELDLVFAFDCTGSMGSYLHQAQASIKRIARQIISEEHASVRTALVAYRDNPPEDSSFETEVLPFTDNIDEMERALMKYSAEGGGDGPECVADALHQVLNLSYRPNAAKVCVLIADAPPHGLGESGDGFPNGSPHGYDPYAIGRGLASKGVTCYCVGCEPVLSSQYRFARTFFESIAELTAGQYLPLGTAEMLADVIIGGAREEMALEKLMAAAKEELEGAARAGIISMDDDDACEAYVTHQMQSKGYRAQSLQCAGRKLAPVSQKAKSWSRLASLEEVREATKSERAEYSEYDDDLGSCKMDSLESLELCAAPSRRAKPSLFGKMSSIFGKSVKAPTPCAAPPRSRTLSAHMERSSLDHAMPCSMERAEHGSYSLAEQDLSAEQGHRLYSKLKSRSKA